MRWLRATGPVPRLKSFSFSLSFSIFIDVTSDALRSRKAATDGTNPDVIDLPSLQLIFAGGTGNHAHVKAAEAVTVASRNSDLNIDHLLRVELRKGGMTRWVRSMRASPAQTELRPTGPQ